MRTRPQSAYRCVATLVLAVTMLAPVSMTVGAEGPPLVQQVSAPSSAPPTTPDAPAPPAGGPRPTVALSPTHGYMGQTVTVTGQSVAPYPQVRVAWLLAEATLTAAVVDVDSAYRYTATVEVPADAASGAARICAAVSESELAEFACADFTVDAPPPGSIVGQLPMASSSLGTVLAPALNATFLLRTPTGKPVASTPIQPDGTFQLAQVPPGSYIGVVSGEVNTLVGTVPTEVTPGKQKQIYLPTLPEALGTAPGPKGRTCTPPGNTGEESVATVTVSITPDGAYLALADSDPAVEVDITIAATPQVNPGVSITQVAFAYRTADDTEVAMGTDMDGLDGWQITYNASRFPAGTKWVVAKPSVNAGCGQWGNRGIEVNPNPLDDPMIRVSDRKMAWNAAELRYEFSGTIPDIAGVLPIEYPSNPPTLPLVGKIDSKLDAGVRFTAWVGLNRDVSIRLMQPYALARLLGQDLYNEHVDLPQADFPACTAQSFLCRSWRDLSLSYRFDPLLHVGTTIPVFQAPLATFWGIVTVNASISIGFGGDLILEGTLYPLQPNLEATLTPEVSTSLSISIWVDILLGVVSAGADATTTLTLGLPMNLDTAASPAVWLDDPYLRIRAYLNLWARVNVWFWKKRWNLASYELLNYNIIGTAAAPAAQTQAAASSPPRVMAAPATASGPSGRMLSAYIEDTAPTEPTPRMQLMVRAWDTPAAAWGAPTALTDGSHAVMDPAVAFVGPAGDALLVWSENPMTEAEDSAAGDDLSAILARQELYYAYLNGTSQAWSSPVRLTDDALSDGRAALAGDATGATLAWVKDMDGNAATRADWRIAVSEWQMGAQGWGAVELLDAVSVLTATRRLLAAPAPSIGGAPIAPAAPRAAPGEYLPAAALAALGDAAAPGLRAAELHVCATCAYTSVQAAVDAAASGDVIKVAAGTYTRVFLNKQVTIRGGYTPDNWTVSDPVANRTILSGRGQGLGSVLTIYGGVNYQIAPTIEGLEISDGSTHLGGGVYIAAFANPILSRNRITGNFVDEYGGGIYIAANAAATLSGNLISGNYAWQPPDSTRIASGGGIYVECCSMTGAALVLTNNAVVRNSGVAAGGGIYISGRNAILRHNTVAGNILSDGSGYSEVSGIYIDGGGTVDMTNNIVADDIIVRSPAAVNLNNELLSSAGSVSGDGTIDVRRVLTGTPGFAPDGYHLTPGSAAVDEGVATAITTDIDGEVRPQGAAPDIGADEITPACLARVGGGESTYESVQAAVDAAAPGATVQIAGVCTGTFSRNGQVQMVYVDKALTLRGGYDPGDWTVAQSALYPTLLDAAGTGRVLYTTGSGAVTIENLTLAGGRAGVGGCIAAHGAALTLNATVVRNCAADIGGGIHLESGSLALNAGQVLSSTAAYDGGGIYVAQAGASLTIDGDSVVAGNRANGVEFWNGGGGLYIQYGAVSLLAGQVRDNAALSGGGVFVDNTSAVFTQTGASLITHNTAKHGGGLFVDFGRAALLAGQVLSNTASLAGGGAYTWDGRIALEGGEIRANHSANGGGLFAYEPGSRLRLAGGLIAENTATAGGGVFVHIGTTALESARIVDNRATENGGGLFVSRGRIEGSGALILHNSAPSGGGLWIGAGGMAAADNLVIADSPRGGGIALGGGTVHLRHATLARNGAVGLSAEPSGAVLARAVLTNTIIVSSTTGVAASGGSTAQLDHVLWFGNTANTSGAVTVTDPVVGDPNLADDGYHLRIGSAAIDRGIDVGVTIDIDGDKRPQRSAPDLGADEWYGWMNAQVSVARANGATALIWTVDADSEIATNGDRRLAVADATPGGWTITVPNDLPLGADSPSAAFTPAGDLTVAFVVRGKDADGVTDVGIGNQAVLWSAQRSVHGWWDSAPVRDAHAAPVRAEQPRLSAASTGEMVLLFRQFGEIGTNGVLGQLALTQLNGGTTREPIYLTDEPVQHWQPAVAVNTLTSQAVILNVSRRTPGAAIAHLVPAQAGAQVTVEPATLSDGDNAVESLVLTALPDPALDPELALSRQHAPAGASVVVTASLRNVGRGPATGLTVRLYVGTAANKTLIASRAIAGEFAFNETLPVPFNIASAGGAQPLYAEVVTSGTDSNPANNAATGDLGDLLPPTMVSVVVSTGYENALAVGWMPPLIPGVAGYRILRGTQSGGPYAMVGDATGTTYTDLLLEPELHYYYVVQAYDAIGVRSAYSLEGEGWLSRYRVYLPVVLRLNR